MVHNSIILSIFTFLCSWFILNHYLFLLLIPGLCKYIITVKSSISTDKAKVALTDLPSLLTQNLPPKQPHGPWEGFLAQLPKNRLSVVPVLCGTLGCYQEATCWTVGPLEVGTAAPSVTPLKQKPQSSSPHAIWPQTLPTSSSWTEDKEGLPQLSTRVRLESSRCQTDP